MSFVMVDSDKPAAQAESHRLCSLKSHHQGAWQPGTSSCRYRFEPSGLDPCLAQGARGDRNEIPQMLACREFRNHAAIFRMQLRLRRNNIGENFSVVND